MISEQVKRVSRSFGLVIDQLAEPLRTEVQIAYLVFRLGDNIEDTSSLSPSEKQELLESFLEALRAGHAFQEALLGRGARSWLDLTETERELFGHTDGIIDAYGRLCPEARESLLDQASLMFRGMARMQRVHREGGYLVLADAEALEEYCFYVAGTVGDYLTDRFLAGLPGLDPRRRAQLLGARRALSLVLQVTNILRDVRDDHSHGHVFYPRSFFDRFDAPTLLAPEHREEVLRAGIRMTSWLLPAVRLASAYVLGLPTRSRSLRLFCAIPYAMALQTLTLAVGNPALGGLEPVKIRRHEVSRTVLAARLFAPSDLLLDAWLRRVGRGFERRVSEVALDSDRAASSRFPPPSFERFDPERS